ncbi:MAG: hypothetical protein ACMUIP_07435 [bacterium]
MIKSGFSRMFLIIVVIMATLFIFAHISAQAQFLPFSYYYTSPLAFTTYPYTNTLNTSLLGYLPFSPFLNPATTALYAAAGITTYPYTYQILNQYTTTIPFTTLDPLSPYALPAYPSYLYGDPAWYAYWVDLNW